MPPCGCESAMPIELPNSALIVLNSLGSQGPMTPKTIISRIDLPSRTITFALHLLLEEDIVRRVPNLLDMRQPYYHINIERFKELELAFMVDRVTHLQPEIRHGSLQGSTFNK